MGEYNFDNYNNFISHIKDIVSDNNLLQLLLEESNDLKLNRIIKFNNSLHSSKLFNNLIKNKTSLFSHKHKDKEIISKSLFGSTLSLNKIFNNQDTTTQLELWEDLHNIILSYNEYLLLSDPNNNNIIDKINKLKENQKSKIIKRLLETKEGVSKILNTETLNPTTNDMINDIFKIFESSLSSSNTNPFNNIFEICKTIADKYKDKIENGDINLEDILNNIKNIPGMENMSDIIKTLTNQQQEQYKDPIIIDENFSTSLVPQGDLIEPESSINVKSILQTMDNLSSFGLDKNIDMDKITNIFNKISSLEDSTELNNIFEQELGIDINKFTNEFLNK